LGGFLAKDARGTVLTRSNYHFQPIPFPLAPRQESPQFMKSHIEECQAERGSMGVRIRRRAVQAVGEKEV